MKKGTIGGIVAGMGVLIVIAFLYVGGIGPFRPSHILVSGRVATTGFGTHPTGLSFTSKSTGRTSTTSVVGNAYSMQLQNDQTYDIYIAWSGLLGSSGTAYAGTLRVYTRETSITANFSG